MNKLNAVEIEQLDREIVWHPYASMPSTKSNLLVASAEGSKLYLENGEVLIDGMASWWTAIHGYRHPILNRAAIEQLEKMSHVMFGGLTHRPAVELAQLLVEISPGDLNKVFFCDSGSVAIEVAMKMALQYWISQGEKERTSFLTIRKGYHGDTLHAMSVCDPVGGMHSMFSHTLPKQYFIAEPQSLFHEELSKADCIELERGFEASNGKIAGFILEPIVQGAGGMRFYSPAYLKKVRQLCDEYGVLLICDEIASGFGRTGKMFASEHADIVPDILALGKSLTGGYLTLAATLTRSEVAEVISAQGEKCLMHGPTFMGNPLACAVAKASVELLMSYDWVSTIADIESILHEGLAPCRELAQVKEVRCLGAIGVVELVEGVDVSQLQDEVCRHGVWLRPFRNLLYTMPPYIIKKSELETICRAMHTAIKSSR